MVSAAFLGQVTAPTHVAPLIRDPICTALQQQVCAYTTCILQLNPFKARAPTGGALPYIVLNVTLESDDDYWTDGGV